MSKYKEQGIIYPNDKDFSRPNIDMPFAGHYYYDDNFYYQFNVLSRRTNMHCSHIATGGIVVVESNETKKKSYYLFNDSKSLRDESYQNLDAYVCDCFNYIKYQHKYIIPILIIINGKIINIIPETDELILWKRDMYSQITYDIGNDKSYFKSFITNKTSEEKKQYLKEKKLKSKSKKCTHCNDGVMKLVDNYTRFQCIDCCYTES